MSSHEVADYRAKENCDVDQGDPRLVLNVELFER